MAFEVKSHLLNTPVSAERFEKLSTILSSLGLRSSLHLLHVKHSNNFQSYHNYQHMISVALFCYDAAEHYSLTGYDTRMLILAALYHDLDHSGHNDTTDVVNVARSIVNADRILRIVEPDLDDNVLKIISKLILVTENTHLVSASTRLEMILVDADILQATSLDGKQWIQGLNDEQDAKHTGASTRAFLRGRIKTEWAREKISRFDFASLD